MKSILRFIGIAVLGISIGATNLAAQTLSGVVIDEHGDPAIGASVYLDGTSIGCSADAYGHYSLTVKEPVNTNLVVSMVGYQTVVLANPFQHPVQKIVLQPTTVEIKAVVITGDHFTRKQKLRIFRRQLLGNTQAGRRCRILNEEVVTFSYSKRDKLLEAMASKPLVIFNPYLGYKVTFDMVEFQVKFSDNTLLNNSMSGSYFLGTIFFKDDKEPNGKEEIHRANCYDGSALDFFRAMRDHTWKQRQFELISGGSLISPDSCFTVSDSAEYKKVTVLKRKLRGLVLSGNPLTNSTINLGIVYRRREQSFVVFRTKTFYLDSYGNNSEPSKISFGGELGAKRLGDMLPLDYVKHPKAKVKH